MLDFAHSEPDDFAFFGYTLWHETIDFTSHEQVSQHITQRLFHEIGGPDGEPALALVRIFRLTDVDDLPPEISSQIPAQEKRVMVLTGTYGLREEWCNRQLSSGHKAIPLSLITVPKRIPMFQEVLKQLRVDTDILYATKEISNASGYNGTFHIPHIPSSTAIPDQQSFVKPYGVTSLVGFGGFMGEKNVLYLLSAFSRVPVDPSQAAKFYQLQTYIGTALADGASRPHVFNPA